MSLCRSLALACLFSTLVSPHAGAKALQPTSLPMVPGDLQSTPQGERIALQGGRSLLWPRQGPLTLQGPNDAVLFQVDLGGTAKRSGGAEALGLEVEETDLGRRAGQEEISQRETGADRTEAGLGGAPRHPQRRGGGAKPAKRGRRHPHHHHPLSQRRQRLEDRMAGLHRRNLFRQEKEPGQRHPDPPAGGLTASLQQYADGSYLRNYSQAAGTFRVTYDANDRSYRLSFANSQGDILAELDCGETCTED